MNNLGKRGNPKYSIPLPEVTRVEVIDSMGRSYTCYGATGAGATGVEIDIQDDGKTLKIFLKNKE